MNPGWIGSLHWLAGQRFHADALVAFEPGLVVIPGQTVVATAG